MFPWGRAAAVAAIAALAGGGVVAYVSIRAEHHVVALVAPGSQAPAAAVIQRDFPAYHIPVGPGHDGQAFYAIARAPMHPDAVAPYLERPRYRFQRILLPLLAWASHPTGGGTGLVIALWFWCVVGVWLTGFASAMLARALGASERNATRLAWLVPVLPGALMAMNVTVADALALGLALLAMALDARRARGALAFAILAVLAKETALLLLIGWVLRRSRATKVRLALIPGAVAVAWWLWLRVALGTSAERHAEFQPVVGLLRSAGSWLHGNAGISAITVLAAVAVGSAGLVRAGRRSPMFGTIALQLLLLTILSHEVLFSDVNGPRAVLPLLVVGLIALACPRHIETAATADKGARAVGSRQAVRTA